MIGYYDLILALIPIALLGGTAALLATGLSLTVAVPLSATVAVGLVGHAMFVNGPSGRESGAVEQRVAPAAD